MFSPVTAVEKSKNAKIGLVSSTYVTQATCPKTCPWFNSGCYSESGTMAFTTRRLNKSEETNVDVIAEIEARAVLGLSGKNPLRLHVVGDTTTSTGAKLLSDACKEYSSRYNQKVWTYTHCHDVPRIDWGQVSILRSCENINQVVEARNAGYASAMVVAEFEDTKAYDIGEGQKGLPCPNQTKGVTCNQCKLCWNDQHLIDNNLTILFAAHSAQKEKMKIKLDMINASQ